MDFSNFINTETNENSSELIESLNLLVLFLLMDSEDIETLYSKIETKLGYVWDGDGWLKIN